MNILEWLPQFATAKGQQPTHVCMHPLKGSYTIPSTQHKQLMDLLYDYVFVHKHPFGLAERSAPITAIRVDIDLCYPIEQTDRRYTLEQIKELIDAYMQVIQCHLSVERAQLVCYLLEKRSPHNNGHYFKDGIHFVYPHIQCDVATQLLVRQSVLQKCHLLLSNLGYNAIETMIDKPGHTWLMYGCSKPNNEPYLLTHVFDQTLRDLPITSSQRQLIEILSTSFT